MAGKIRPPPKLKLTPSRGRPEARDGGIRAAPVQDAPSAGVPAAGGGGGPIGTNAGGPRPRIRADGGPVDLEIGSAEPLLWLTAMWPSLSAESPARPAGRYSDSPKRYPTPGSVRISRPAAPSFCRRWPT